MKKFLAITLTVCMMVCALIISVSAASQAYDTVEEAVAAIGLKSLADKVDQGSIYGSGTNPDESFDMLFDDDVTTKFGTGDFPAFAAWKMDKAYSIGGIIFATANDNASYVGRNPSAWVLKGSHDDNTWVDIASGTSDDFEDTDFMYYTVKFDKGTEAYEYFMFEVEGPESGTFFQMSELVLCEGEAPAAPVVEEPAPVVEEAPAVVEEAPAAPVEVAPAATTAPATSDYVIIITSVVAVIALAAIIVLKKKAVR